MANHVSSVTANTLAAISGGYMTSTIENNIDRHIQKGDFIDYMCGDDKVVSVLVISVLNAYQAPNNILVNFILKERVTKEFVLGLFDEPIVALITAPKWRRMGYETKEAFEEDEETIRYQQKLVREGKNPTAMKSARDKGVTAQKWIAEIENKRKKALEAWF